jgi:hypothetical protein
MIQENKLERAFEAFDAYNAADPHKEEADGKVYPKELLYSLRMSGKLNEYAPDAPEHVKLAVRCQHIGRWEIPRNSFPMDRKGYLQWRSKLSLYHTDIASRILTSCGYDNDTIEKVKFLLQKKQLNQHHPETQLLEDVVCLVFIEHYLHAFALQHEDEKVIDILKKTIRKMSTKALKEAGDIDMSEKVKKLVEKAVSN